MFEESPECEMSDNHSVYSVNSVVFQPPRKSMHSISMRCVCGLTCSLPFEIFEERYVEALERRIQLLEIQNDNWKQLNEKRHRFESNET